jgi:hypothetical protein
VEVVHEGTTLRGTTRNLSLGGIFVELDRALPFGARVSLCFQIPTHKEPTMIDGFVRWIDQEEGEVRGVGILFDGLRARDVWALSKYFERPVEET